MQKKWCGAFFLLVLLPLCSESLRDQSKTYFDSIQWEELNELAISPISEPYTIEGSRPIPYADTIDDGGILPSLPQLGILDYQNIPEDLLTFCDTVTAAVVAKSMSDAFFTAQKPFLPHLGHFIIEHLPDLSYAFYGRPSFKQDGSALIQIRLTVKDEESTEQQGTALKQETPAAEPTITEAQDTETEHTEAQNRQQAANITEDEKTQSDTELLSEEDKNENLSEVPPLFFEEEKPLFIMMELVALKEADTWKISHIDLKGAEYADSAHED